MWGGEADDDGEMLCRRLQKSRMRGGIASMRPVHGGVSNYNSGEGGVGGRYGDCSDCGGGGTGGGCETRARTKTHLAATQQERIGASKKRQMSNEMEEMRSRNLLCVVCCCSDFLD